MALAKKIHKTGGSHIDFHSWEHFVMKNTGFRCRFDFNFSKKNLP